MEYYVLPQFLDRYYGRQFTLDYCAANRFGAYLSKQRIRDYGKDTLFDPSSILINAFNNQNIQPQVAIPSSSFITDTTAYTKVSGTVRAEGGEKYLTFGNFYPMDQTWAMNLRTGIVRCCMSSDTSNRWQSAYLLDDVALVAVDPPDSLLYSSKDTVICPGDSLYISAGTTDSTMSILWDNGSAKNQRLITKPGTYFVKLECGCARTLIDTIVVSPVDTLPALAIADTTLCPGDIVNYNLPSGLTYHLNGQLSASSFVLHDTGQYTLQAANNCHDTLINFRISQYPVKPLPLINITDTVKCADEPIAYNLPEGFQYTLNQHSVSSFLSINELGAFLLAISNNCESDSLSWEITNQGCGFDLKIPNAFTPTGDGLNECFEIKNAFLKEMEIWIYSRWGELVYHAKGPSPCWDGTYSGQPLQGTFAYQVKATSLENEVVIKRGVVNVIR